MLHVQELTFTGPWVRPFAHFQRSPPCVCPASGRCSFLPPSAGLSGKRWPMLPPGGNAEVGAVLPPCCEAMGLSWSRQSVLCPGVGAALAFRTLGPLMMV